MAENNTFLIVIFQSVKWFFRSEAPQCDFYKVCVLRENGALPQLLFNKLLVNFDLGLPHKLLALYLTIIT